MVIVGAVLACLALLALLPLGVGLLYAETLRVSVYIFKLRITLFPRKPKKIKEKNFFDEKQKTSDAKKKKPKKKKTKAPVQSEKKKAKKRTFSETWRFVGDLARLVRDLMLKFGGYAKVRVAELRVVIGTGDAARTAELYGAAEAAVAELVAALDECVDLTADTRRDISVHADFLAEHSTIACDVRLQLRMWQIVVLGVSALFGFLKTKRKQNENV